MRPIISICIPTFNRSSCLENLLQNLKDIKDEHGMDVEICISNNDSTDDTSLVVERWRILLNIKVKTQLKNIGGSQNAIEVTKIASGRWILLIGDDDEIKAQNFDKLLVFLRSQDENTDWVLLGVADISGQESLLGDIKAGHYDARSFRKLLLKKGLYRFGFIGMHLFPEKLKPTFWGLTSSESQPWAHIALLLRHLQFGNLQVFKEPVVSQAANGAKLRYSPGDWVSAGLRKLDIVAGVQGSADHWYWYSQILILREIYSWGGIKNIIFWKVVEPSDFKARAFEKVTSRYKLLKSLKIFTAGHLFILLMLLVAPPFLINLLLKILGKEKIFDIYMAEKEANRDFDWISRGV